MATPGRVQAPELNLRPSLNPAPVVNVQPVAPVNRQGAGSNLINIAESLSGLSSSFARFASTQKTEAPKQDEYLAGSLSGMTYDQLKTHFEKNPDLLKKEKVAMMYAGKYANTFGTNLLSGELTKDWDGTTPLDQHIAAKQQEYISQLPDDPMVRAYFNSSANPYVQNYIMGRTKVEAEANAAETVDVLSAMATNAREASKAATGAASSAPGVSKRLPLVTGTQPGRQPLQMKGVQGVVLDRWEQVQGAFGKQLTVVSAARDAETNKAAGGAKDSQHLHGNALDIDVSGLDLGERRRLLEIASAMGFTGIGIYNNSIHLDMRKDKKVWGPSHSYDSVPAWAKMFEAKHKGGGIKALPYSVNSSAIAVDAVFSSVTESPQWKQMTGPQRSAFWYNYAFNINPQSEDDLRLIEGILTSQRPGGAPPLVDDPEYAVKVRTLIDTRKEEFRKQNIDGQSAINLQVTEAISKGAGLAELQRIREGSGNLLSDSYWMQASEQMRNKEIEVQQQGQALAAHNQQVDAARSNVRDKLASGAAFGAINDIEVPDPKTPGKTVTYTGKQLKQDVMNETLNGIDQMAAEKKLPEEAKWGLIATIFSKSNETIPRWEEALAATPKSFNPAEAAGGVSDQMVSNAKLYDYLKGSGNYLYLDAHLKGDNTKQFWSMYDSFRGQGQDERQALFSTYKVMNDPGVLAAAREEVNFAKGKYFKSGVSFADSQLEGSPIASAKVSEMATAIAATGKSGEEAIEQAVQTFKDTHVYTLNSWVPKNLKGLPDNFTDNINEYVGSYVKQYGAKANPPISDVEDVMIAPDASGSRFYLFQKSTGLPLMGKEPRGQLSRTGVLAVSIQTLRDFDKLKNDQASIASDKARSDLSAAIETAGSPNAPTKQVGGGRMAPITVPLTPQEIVEQGNQTKADQTSKEVQKSERLDPNNLKVKSKKLKDLTDEQLRGYVDRASADPNRYLPEEWNLIKSEAMRRGWNIE